MDEIHSEIQGFKGIYREFGKLIGEDNVKLLYEEFHGLQILFPTKLYETEYVYNRLKIEYPQKRISDLAKKYNYSASYISKMLKNIRVSKGGK